MHLDVFQGRTQGKLPSDDGGVGTHSNRKLGATSAALYGCATLEIESRGRWKVSKGKQVQVYIDVKRAYEDACCHR